MEKLKFIPYISVLTYSIVLVMECVFIFTVPQFFLNIALHPLFWWEYQFRSFGIPEISFD